MKKLILVCVGVLIVAVLLIYVLIPSTLTVSRIVPLRCKSAAAWRFVSDEARWGAWWPEEVSRKDFHIQALTYQSAGIGIQGEKQVLDSRLTILPVGNQDSSLLQWYTQLHSGWDPVGRVRQYLWQGRLEKTMDRVLEQARLYSEKGENLYGGVNIWIGTLQDTLLVTTRTEKMGMPTSEDIYAQVGRLSNYISKMHCHQTNSPMANISPDTSRPGGYKLMVAMPVDCRLENDGEFVFKRLIPWKYLIGEIRGGAGTVANAFPNMDTYIRDHQITVMAIPFQMMVSDRRQEPDSTRWVTRIYYPIF
ncbi:MAG TPA: GyrI-like domain-containing protein [Puia sp.]|jgi:hypothetical protein